MPIPVSLEGLTPREAIADALYRAIYGLDHNDFSMVELALTDDITLTTASRTVTGLSDLKTQVFSTTSAMDTSHMVNNLRIDYQQGAKTASLTSLVLAQHCPLGKGMDGSAPKYLVAGEYILDLVDTNGDGLWKIKTWVLNVIWTQGDRAAVIPQ